MALKIARLSGISAKDFHKYFWKPEKPVVLTDAITHWPALQKWSLDYFEKQIGAEVLRCAEYRRQKDSWNPQEVVRQNQQLKRVPFSEFAKNIKSQEERFYYQNVQPLRSTQTQLRKDIDAFSFIKRTRFERFLGKLLRVADPLWSISTPGTVTPIHYDGFHTFAAQITGKKIWKIYSPHEWRNLSLPSKFVGYRWVSPVQPETNARYTEIELSKGELLFVPRLWPHHVATIELSFLLNFWMPVWLDALRIENIMGILPSIGDASLF